MLRILGSPKRLCSGLTRREMLRAGGLGLFGLRLSDLLRLSELQAAAAPARGFGKAKACILLYLYGSPSQLELCDMKPDAPVEIRGELGPIQSSLPGLAVCELLPNMAKVMDRVTVVRSMSHPYPIHGVAYALTGVPTIDVPMELNPRDPRHWPFIGSVVDYLEGQREGGPPQWGVPRNMALPFPFSSQRIGEVPRAGPYAAFLGSAYNPVWTKFEGKATRTVRKTLRDMDEEIPEPYMGISRDSHFTLAGAAQLQPDITLDRLDRRRSLLEQFDQARRDLAQTQLGQGVDRFREMAFSLIDSQKVRAALDVREEPHAVRDSYGMTLFGQAALAARRLVEAGTRLVTVVWDEYGLAGSAWDTHWNHYPRTKDQLLPGLDRAFAGLILDLEARGMLDEVLVACLSEHGRTPRLNKSPGGGRDHWSKCYTVLLAGGGIARGNVVGKSDRHAAEVVERPVSPKDILATIYYLMGIDPHTTLTDRLSRPVPVAGDGKVVPELLA